MISGYHGNLDFEGQFGVFTLALVMEIAHVTVMKSMILAVQFDRFSEILKEWTRGNMSSQGDELMKISPTFIVVGLNNAQQDELKND